MFFVKSGAPLCVMLEQPHASAAGQNVVLSPTQYLGDAWKLFGESFSFFKRRSLWSLLGATLGKRNHHLLHLLNSAVLPRAPVLEWGKRTLPDVAVTPRNSSPLVLLARAD